MVIDSHVHAWGPPDEAHPWVNARLVADVDRYAVDAVYTAEKLLADMDDTGVDEAVVVGFPLAEWTDNWYTIEAAREHDRLSGVVLIDPFADGAAGTLREAMAVDGVIGVRLGAICPVDRMWEGFDPTATWLSDAIREEAFWTAVRDTDAYVQVLAHHRQLEQVRSLVETYPDLTYAFDHLAYVDPSVPPPESPLAGFADLAEYDGVAMKVSEAAHRSNDPFPYRDLHDYVRWLVEAFGRERVIWGSDFPNVSDVATYAESLEWLDRVDGLSPTDRAWLTGRAFERHVGTG